MRLLVFIEAAFAVLFCSCMAVPADGPANEPSAEGDFGELGSALSPLGGESNPDAPSSTGDVLFVHSNSKGKTYHHTNYSFSYSEEDEQSEWVAYELSKTEVGGKMDRKDEFVQDPIVDSQSADPDDYMNSGYDRGHLAPAGDMKFDETAMDECFYTSNVSPQVRGFNQGVWNDLEMQVRAWTKKYGSIYVVTGPVLPKNSKEIRKMYSTKHGKDEKTKVTVPDKFYKILFDFSKKGKEKMIAFVIPNEDTDTPFTEFVTTVDEVEKMTGIDFFSNLDMDLQKKCESHSDLSKWPEATYLNYSNAHKFNH